MNKLKTVTLGFLIAVLAGLFGYGFYQAYKTVFPERIPLSDFHQEWGDRKAPQEYGLKYENVFFRLSNSEPLISGWYIKGIKKDTAVIVVEGWGQNRNKALCYSNLFNKLGYPVLTFDFRGQGASEGRICSMGYLEKNDIAGAVDYLIEQKKAKKIILFGVSMGGVASLLYAAEASRPETQAVIVDSIYFDYKMLIRDKIRYISPWLVYPLSNFINISSSILMRVPVSKISLIKARKIEIPVLIIHSSTDREIPMKHALKLKKIVKNAQVISIENARHAENFKKDPQKYQKAIVEFLKD